MKFLLNAGFAESLLTFRGPLIDALLSNGATVHVSAPGLGWSNPIRKVLEAKGVRVHEIKLHRASTNPFADLLLLIRLALLMRRIRPDIVLGYTIKPVIYGSLAAWLVGVPRRFALVTGLGYAFTDDGRRGILRRLIQLMYRVALSRAQKVFFQNPDDEILFRDRGILASRTRSVVVNGSGVDTSEYSLVPQQPGPPTFLLIARLLGDKGVREFAQAARHIRARHHEARFALVGWIDENPDAIHQAELDAWIADGTVDYLGRMKDVRPAIANCNVYVLPSYREGTPRTVLEAMAMGRAVITTDAPGCRETVVDGDNGFLVPVKSVDALVAAMLRFIDDPGLAPRMGGRSRRIAEDKYDVHKVNEVMLREMGITDQGISKVTQHG